MSLRAVLNQVLAFVVAIRRAVAYQTADVEVLREESAEHGELLRQILAEVKSPEPQGSVTIDVGPVSEQP